MTDEDFDPRTGDWYPTRARVDLTDYLPVHRGVPDDEGWSNPLCGDTGPNRWLCTTSHPTQRVTCIRCLELESKPALV